ncbi:MAG: D-tyrosyl-tRNA(Tyr) deacylase [Dehalococcoidia bacterium]|nr:D-tyrosyl-tRNA(Tyr) deacylase [Dehalococcoidia bacterium]
MRLVIQRVSRASVDVDGETVAAIGRGLLILAGVADGDDEPVIRRLAAKCAEMRLFPDADGRFAHSLVDLAGEALVVSQFTLLADVRRGRRPSFSGAASPGVAAPLVDAFAQALRALGVRVACGRFGAHMSVSLENDGPVTIVVDSAELDRPRRA